jgi:hypothetical protein
VISKASPESSIQNLSPRRRGSKSKIPPILPTSPRPVHSLPYSSTHLLVSSTTFPLLFLLSHFPLNPNPHFEQNKDLEHSADFSSRFFKDFFRITPSGAVFWAKDEDSSQKSVRKICFSPAVCHLYYRGTVYVPRPMGSHPYILGGLANTPYPAMTVVSAEHRRHKFASPAFARSYAFLI